MDLSRARFVPLLSSISSIVMGRDDRGHMDVFSVEAVM